MKKIAIIGLSNVGKSSLFNKICHRKIAIIDDSEGTTRDYITCYFQDAVLIDTAGCIDPKKAIDPFIATSDLILYIIDGSIGPQALDYELIKKFNKQEIWLILNKKDKHSFNENWPLQTRRIFSVSAEHDIGELEKALQLGERLSDSSNFLTIIGKCNSGKSSLINLLLGKERSIVSNTAGQTRDILKEKLNLNDDEYVWLVDTPGYQNNKTELELIAQSKRNEILTFTNGIIVLLDSQTGLTKIDLHILQDAMRFGEYIIIAINKTDLPWEQETFYFLKNYNFPIIPISVKEKINIDLLLQTVQKLKKPLPRLSQKLLNKLVSNQIYQDKNHKYVKIKHIVQTSVFFIYFSKARLSESSEKFLKRLIIEKFDLIGYNIKLKHKQISIDR